jgi:hypothetical protein
VDWVEPAIRTYIWLLVIERCPLAEVASSAMTSSNGLGYAIPASRFP